MQIVVVYSLVSLMMIQGCNLETTVDSLTGNEKRLAEFRQEFEADSNAFETFDIAHAEPSIDKASRADNTNSDSSEVTEGGTPSKIDKCCQVGRLLAERGLHCKRYRFSQASRRMKLKLVNATLIRLHIKIDETNRQTIYNPFRVCILRNSRDIDKCCLLNEHASGGHNKKEHVSSISQKGFGRYGSKRGQSLFESVESMRRYGHVSKTRYGDKRSFREGIHRENYDWQKWAAYRSYRARRERLEKHSAFKRS